jgi:GNAT superfamily N-acetyltransferase
MDVTIGEATSEADIQRVLAVRNAVEHEPQTLAAFRAERAGTRESLDLLAERDGRDVGAGSIAWGPSSVESHNVWIFAWVLPDHRRRGIGGALLGRLVAFAREHGMERMTTLAYADEPESIAFVERRGLQVDGGGQLGRLDLTKAPTDRGVPPIDGIEIVTSGERADLDRQAYELHSATHDEIPMMAGQPMPTFETWLEIGGEGSGYLRDQSLMALEGGRVVGTVDVFDNGDEGMFIGMTAVHPDTRRRGIARLLKVELERRARAAGWKRIETWNDGTNDRIRGLNESLGYVYNPPYVALKGPLPPAPDPAPAS